MDDVVGVDVSKADLKVFRLHGNARLCVSNDRMGFVKLRDWLGPTHPQLIVFEVTGAYHRSLESFLHESELPCTKVNPKQARRFSQAVGKLAKTDRVDAKMLARMGRQLDLQAQPAPHENHQILQDLLSARRALIKDRTAAKTRLKVTNLPILKRVLQRRVRQIDEDIKAVEAEMQRLVARDAGYQERAKILATIPGVGWLTAVTMAIEIPELGKLGNKQIAALAGLAPMNQQSGTQDRMRKIQGGRPWIRRTLYMPALVAARFNPDMKRMYDSLIGRGKRQKVALTAIMRKLVTLANALIWRGEPWSPRST